MGSEVFRDYDQAEDWGSFIPIWPEQVHLYLFHLLKLHIEFRFKRKFHY